MNHCYNSKYIFRAQGNFVKIVWTQSSYKQTGLKNLQFSDSSIEKYQDLFKRDPIGNIKNKEPTRDYTNKCVNPVNIPRGFYNKT